MLRDIRTDYRQYKLEEKDLAADPLNQFRTWLKEAIENKLEEPTAMTLATSENGCPDSRIVLLKELNSEGFIFFTNYNSTKGRQIKKNRQAALNFFWSKLERQVRVKGTVSLLSERESTDYFRARPRESQLGAWASEQSSEIKNRDILETRFRHYQEAFRDKEIEKPEFWGGYLVTPFEIEFWQGRPNRLHDRFRYFRKDKGWLLKRLAP